MPARGPKEEDMIRSRMQAGFRAAGVGMLGVLVTLAGTHLTVAGEGEPAIRTALALDPGCTIMRPLSHQSDAQPAGVSKDASAETVSSKNSRDLALEAFRKCWDLRTRAGADGQVS